MARTAFHLRVQFVDVYCHEEADGPGDAEPYIWPVFFKIDGDYLRRRCGQIDRISDRGIYDRCSWKS